MHKMQRFYTGLIIALGLAILPFCFLHALPAFRTHNGLVFSLFLLILMAVCRLLPIYITAEKTIDISFIPVLACVVTYGPDLAVVLFALSSLFMVEQDPESRRYYAPLYRNPRKELFNTGNILLSIGIAGVVFIGFMHLFSPPPALISWPMLLAATIFSLLNIILNLVFFLFYYITADGGRFSSQFVQNVSSILPNLLCTIPLGLLIAMLLSQPNGLLYLFLFMVPLLMARYSFKLYLDSHSMHMRTIVSLSRAIDAKDPYTQNHSARVAYISEQIARAMHLRSGMVEQIKMAALLHDVGKIGINDAILQKPDKLTTEEYAQIQQHPEIGYEIIASIHLSSTVNDGVLYHHRRYDGAGYPAQGPADSRLPLAAAIIAVADSYDAMTSDRPYRKGMSGETAISILKSVSGTQLDPAIVEAFLRIAPTLNLDQAYREIESEVL